MMVISLKRPGGFSLVSWLMPWVLGPWVAISCPWGCLFTAWKFIISHLCGKHWLTALLSSLGEWPVLWMIYRQPEKWLWQCVMLKFLVRDSLILIMVCFPYFFVLWLVRVCWHHLSSISVSHTVKESWHWKLHCVGERNHGCQKQT